MSDIPRRICVDKMDPAEIAIRDAIIEVEKVGGHPLLTDAVNLLSQAQTKVADFIDAPFTRITANVSGDENKYAVTVLDDLGRERCKFFVRPATPDCRAWAIAIASCINTHGLVVEPPK